MPSFNHAALTRFLERLLRRSCLSAEEQAEILGLKSHVAQADNHRDIVRPGMKVDHACLVVAGLVGRFDQMADGQRQITAIHIPGDMCDLHSVVSPIAGWGLEALTTTTILRIPHADLRELAMRYPAIALAFWRDTTADASIFAKWVSNIGRREARARLAHLFCELGMRMEQAEVGTRTDFPMPIAQVQLADALGLTPVHVNRTLQMLKREGIVAKNDKTIHVSDWTSLAAIAQFDPAFLLITPPGEREAA
jgi:CRP-like cAMP-binding protein